MLGIALVDKPIGMSSHDVVNRVRRVFQTKRVGHAGTLDPLASGLLIVAVGPATRFLQYLSLEPKEYVCQVRFGRATTTQDAEGETEFEAEVPADIEARLEATIPEFLGLIEQIPPMYSAVKKDGKPLYAYARQGVEVERAARRVHIESILSEDWLNGMAELNVVCSGGTYMRTLAHDLGKRIGCGAYLAGLRRVRAGRFRVDEAKPIEELTDASVMCLREALHPMPEFNLNAKQALAIRHGQAIGGGTARSSGKVVLVTEEGEAIGIGTYDGPMIQPECVLPTEVATVRT